MFHLWAFRRFFLSAELESCIAADNHNNNAKNRHLTTKPMFHILHSFCPFLVNTLISFSLQNYCVNFPNATFSSGAGGGGILPITA